MNDEVQQKAEWRTRLITALLERKHDDLTLFAMLAAGLHQAHSEGLADAVSVLEEVAQATPKHAGILRIVATSLRKLDKMNAESRAEL